VRRSIPRTAGNCGAPTTVPAPGEPGSETWPNGDQWKTGGGSIWVTANYDPATNLAFWGTGNGGPWMGDQRPGDNLFTSSTVAIDVATGAIKGHFQYDPNDSWDWDEVSPPLLIDYTRNGRTIKGLVDVARDGYLWFLERSDGAITFVEGKPYVRHNVFTNLDPKTGRPNVDPARQPGTNREADFCPSHWGGKNWPPVAFNPKTRLLYIPANENLCTTMTGRPVTYSAGRGFTGMVNTLRIVPGADHIRRSAGVECRHRTENLDPQLRQIAELGIDAGHRWRAGVQRRNRRPEVSRLRCDHRQAAVGIPAQFRRRGAADFLFGERQAIYRCFGGWGQDAGGEVNTMADCSQARFLRCRMADRCGYLRWSKLDGGQTNSANQQYVGKCAEQGIVALGVQRIR
jgi:Glucose dehydrogenase